MQTKVCNKCKKELPFDLFSHDKNKKYGLQPFCKKCKAESDKNYINKIKNMEKIKVDKQVCIKCKKPFPLNKFTKDITKKTGYDTYCLSCKHENAKKYYESKGRETYKKYCQRESFKEQKKISDRKYASTEKGKIKHREIHDLWQKRNKIKVQAVSTVNNWIKMGKINPPFDYPCAICKDRAKEYHHWNYEKEHWLDVIPLCVSCHKQIHRTV